MARDCSKPIENSGVVPRAHRKNEKGTARTEDLPHGPISGLRHGYPDVGSSCRRTRIAGEIVVFEGTFNPVVAHAIGQSCDTESYVCRSPSIRVLRNGTAPRTRTSLPFGEKRSIVPAHLSMWFAMTKQPLTVDLSVEFSAFIVKELVEDKGRRHQDPRDSADFATVIDLADDDVERLEVRSGRDPHVEVAGGGAGDR
jgi:hypothetical protein